MGPNFSFDKRQAKTPSKTTTCCAAACLPACLPACQLGPCRPRDQERKRAVRRRPRATLPKPKPKPNQPNQPNQPKRPAQETEATSENPQLQLQLQLQLSAELIARVATYVPLFRSEEAQWARGSARWIYGDLRNLHVCLAAGPEISRSITCKQSFLEKNLSELTRPTLENVKVSFTPMADWVKDVGQ